MDGDGDGFGFDEVAVRADPLQRGLISHCYRMLASTTEAIQVATTVRTTFDATPPSSDRLVANAGAYDLANAAAYDLATRACLARAGARPLPTDLVPASDDPEGELTQRAEVLWLEPIPDSLADDHLVDLQLIAALQRLPAHERAAVILHDLEGWPAPRITDLLGPVALPQARAHFSPAPGHQVNQPELLDRYARAFEEYDVPAIVALFGDDTIWEMPPFTSWFRGARNIGRLISTHCPAKGPGDQILIPIKANRQPAFAVYMRDPVDNIHRAFQIQVLTLTAAGIIHAVAFFDLSLFPTFHLPDLLTGLPPNPYDATPRPHLQRLNHPHD